jgi:hypothetical protein
VFQVAQLSAGLDEVSNVLNGALDSPGNLIDILRLHNSLEVVLQNLGEVVLQFGTTEVLENFFPVGRVVKTSEVGLQLSTENLQRRTLSNTVGTDETKHLSGTGHGKTVKLETVGGVTVGNLGLQVGRQVDDVNGTEGAFLGTDTATDTEALGDEGNLGLGSDLDTQLTRTDDGARLLTFLATFLGFAFVTVDNSNTGKLVRHDG